MRLGFLSKNRQGNLGEDPTYLIMILWDHD